MTNHYNTQTMNKDHPKQETSLYKEPKNENRVCGCGCSADIKKILTRLCNAWEREKKEHVKWACDAGENTLERKTHELCSRYVQNHIDQVETIMDLF